MLGGEKISTKPSQEHLLIKYFTTHSLFHLLGTVSAIPNMSWVIDALVCNVRLVAILRKNIKTIENISGILLIAKEIYFEIN